MKKLLFLLLLVSGIASAQYTPTGSKTRFVNGIGLGTKSDAAFGMVDSLVLYASADSTLKFKFKGTARALAYAGDLSGYVPYTGATDNVNIGNKRFTARKVIADSVEARTSAGLTFFSSSGAKVADYGGGGGSQWTNYGFAGYDANRSAAYTARSFTDKGYVDSSRALDVQLAGTQTITGAKTFSANITASARININGAVDNSTYKLNTLGSVAIRASAAKAYQLSLLQASDSTSGWAFEGDNSGNLTLIRRSSGAYQAPAFSWSSTGSMSNNGSNMTLGSTIGTGTGTLFAKNNFFTALNYGTTGSPIYEEILGYSYDGTARFALQTSNSYNSNQGTGFRLRISNGSGTAIYPITVTNGVDEVVLSSLGTGTVYSNGGILTNTNPSDSSLKNTVKPLGYGLSEVLKLQPKTFYYNSDSAKSSLKYGFIAQDVKQIMPDVVREFNTYKTVDSAGVKVQKTIKKLGLESDGIYVTLVKAIQEQQIIIEDLKKRIILLENKTP